jgi:hypothetical protein
MISLKNAKPGEGMTHKSCDCDGSGYKVVAGFGIPCECCGAGAIVSDRDPGFSGDEALDEADPVTAGHGVPTFTDEQFKEYARLGRLETQAYKLCKRLESIYYSIDDEDRDPYDDDRLQWIMDAAYSRRQRRYAAFQSYCQLIGLRVG